MFWKGSYINFKFVLLILIGIIINVSAVAYAGKDLVKHKETKHFIFYCTDQDIPCLDKLANTLEVNYQRIIVDLETDFNKKVIVEIYPNLKAFHEDYLGDENAPSWFVGVTLSDNKFKIVSPLNPGPSHNYESILKVLLHEFTHVVLSNLNNNLLPRWLDEGIALYEAKQFSPEDKKILWKQLVLEKCQLFMIWMKILKIAVDIYFLIQ